jgi:hypothetical protein
VLQSRPPSRLNPKKERIRDYRWVEIYDGKGNLLIRIGSDHELTQKELDDILQTLSRGDDEWQP